MFQGFLPPPPHLPLSGSTTKKKWKHLSVNILVLIFINTQSFGINKFLNTRRRFQTRHRNWLNLISDLLDNPVSLFCRNSIGNKNNYIFYNFERKKFRYGKKRDIHLQRYLAFPACLCVFLLNYWNYWKGVFFAFVPSSPSFSYSFSARYNIIIKTSCSFLE